MAFETLLSSYLEQKVGISEDFISVALSQHLQNNLLQLLEEGLLIAAGTGNDGKLSHDKKVRSDTIYWLDKKHNNIHETAFLKQMEGFIEYLNSECYAGITSYEFHYSLYEAGSFYVKHLDQFQDNSSRAFSMISYLNANWKEADGGELLLHQIGNNQKVAPTQGKTVFFKSDELIHEVLVTNTRRMSIAGWLKR
ncbi:2OG-Fe(II) oxygenase [Flavobacterium sp.]|uniref:2OG-Fe(II) oxygenase n=1 Tax=Flavobacterium sp. TaxID=239 RepID=UPI00248A80EF|nr:2OG-Fe(II) oxygenase [Flavobacterium sp.]MDI1318429.1 2OG-Fe(II) oxygenase family protein [Flavobacterium sp.]